MKRKIKRKVVTEIYQNNFHTQTQESGLYETDKDGNPTTDPFKDCKTMQDVRAVLLLEKEGRKYLESSFNTGDPDYNAEFVLVKINKRGCSHKQLITKYEFDTCLARG